LFLFRFNSILNTKINKNIYTQNKNINKTNLLFSILRVFYVSFKSVFRVFIFKPKSDPNAVKMHSRVDKLRMIKETIETYDPEHIEENN